MLEVETTLDAGEPMALLCGLPGPELVVRGVGSFWLQPTPLVVVHAGMMGASGRHTQSIPVPNDAALSLEPIGFQVVGGGIKTPIRLSGPGVTVIR